MSRGGRWLVLVDGTLLNLNLARSLEVIQHSGFRVTVRWDGNQFRHIHGPAHSTQCDAILRKIIQSPHEITWMQQIVEEVLTDEFNAHTAQQEREGALR